MPIHTLLIANRGEVVARISRTARRLGISPVGVYSDPDRNSPALNTLDLAIPLHGSSAADTYLDIGKIIEAAAAAGADAVHPGFGFLAERADFARTVIEAGLLWVGPEPDHIALMGNKVAARKEAEAAGLPVLPAATVASDSAAAAAEVGYPLLVKATAGGGGKGMRRIDTEDQLAEGITAATGEAERSFGDGALYLERLLTPARHLEVQLLGDGEGDVIHLFERECSIQRRNQKVIEEAPSPSLDPASRAELCDAAASLGRRIGYRGAGTVEFVTGGGEWFFIEMNTRLQVEHPVTEEVTGIDIVEAQLRIAVGEGPGIGQADVEIRGHAIEARLYAEDPALDWAPATGLVTCFGHSGPSRLESGVAAGFEIGPHYDPMIGKLIAHGSDRDAAAALLAADLHRMKIHGPVTSRNTLAATTAHPAFLAGDTYTSFFEDHPEVLDPTPPPQLVRSHLAAVLLSRRAANRVADRAWGLAPAGWRNVPSSPQRLGLRHRDDDIEIEYSSSTGGLRITGMGEEIDAQLLDCVDGGVTVEIDGARHRVDVCSDDGRWWANSVKGQTEWDEVPRFQLQDAALAAGGTTAPIPGSIIQVGVEVGDIVEAGDLLVVMEAMKMQHRITASGRARVIRVRVVPGDQVDAGDVLVDLEEAD